jgi:Protein of unknown function (DUF4232)
MQRRWQAIGVGAAILVGGMALAACSSGGTGKATGTTLPPTTSTSSPATTTSRPSSTTTTTAPAATTTTVTTKCKLAGLHIAHLGSQGAAGTEESTFSLTNSSAATCTMFGYPGMALLSSSGQTLPTTVVRGGGTGATIMAPKTVTLAPGATAFFNVTSSDVTTATTSCSSGAQVQITPPTNTTSATLPVAIDACDNGKLDVSPIFAGTNVTATQTTAPAT